MQPITDTTWLNTHRFGVRAFNDGKAGFNGFTFAPIGDWTDCPDWNTEPKCGGGFHLMTPEFNGFGFCGKDIELVEYDGECVGINGNKCKVPRLRRIACGTPVLSEALRRCGVNVVDGDATINGGLNIVLEGGPTITVNGGYVRTYGTSRPTITVNGGEVWTCDASRPTMTVNGGYVWTYGTSSPTMTVNNGEVWTCDTSSSTMTVNNGMVRICGGSRPTMTVNRGVVWTCDTSRPTITVNSGEVWTNGIGQVTIIDNRK